MKCKICNADIANNRTYCSLVCSNKARKGEKRIDRSAYCKGCEQPFQRKDSRQTFCSRSCSATFNNTKFVKRIAGLTSRCTQPKERKSLINKWLEGEWDGTTKAGLSSTVRRYLLEQANYRCQECGWSGINPVSGKTTLTVDHIDGCWYNNQIDNLKVLCPNCHSLTPTYGALNKGRGRTLRRK